MSSDAANGTAAPAATADPTVTLATRSTGPSAGGSSPSHGASHSSGSRITTPADALRLDEVQRQRILAGFAALLCVIAAVSMIPMHGDPLAKWVHMPALACCGVSASWVALRLRNPDNYDATVMSVFSVFVAIALATSFFYWGVYSSALLFVPIAVYFLSTSSYLMPVVVSLVLTCVPHAVLGSLVAFDVVADRGVVRAQSLGLYEQLSVLGIAQFGFVVAFLLARGSRKSTADAVEQLSEALVGIGKREALLAEARQDLEHARQVGGPGLYTDQELGSFRLGNLLGRGAMGEVYEATHVATGEPAAVKVLAPQLASDGALVRRFLREVQIAASLTSPHVVKVLEVANGSSPVAFLAMERLSGYSLSDRLRDVSRLKLEHVVAMLRELASGITVAHRAGVIHRDLKPRNVFRHGEGKAAVWKILDFGVSKLAGEQGTLTGGNIIGTPSYMAPEQARGHDVDHRTDIHALGLIVYRALTGRPAFAGPDVPSILYAVTHDMPPAPSQMASLPAAVDLVLAVALAKKPERRFDSAYDLAAALTAAARGEVSADLSARAGEILRDNAWSSRG